MIWLAVDEDGTEYVYTEKPERSLFRDKGDRRWGFDLLLSGEAVSLPLPSGTIKKIIGRKLTWKDKPVCVKEENNE